MLIIIMTIVLYTHKTQIMKINNNYKSDTVTPVKIKNTKNKLIEAPYSPNWNYVLNCSIDSHNQRKCEWIKIK